MTNSLLIQKMQSVLKCDLKQNAVFIKGNAVVEIEKTLGEAMPVQSVRLQQATLSFVSMKYSGGPLVERDLICNLS